MKNKNKLNLISLITALALAGLAAGAAWADTTTQTTGFTSLTSAGTGCVGTNYGYAKMTNSTGTFWITPPANTTNGILTDTSGFPSPYYSIAYVECKKNGLAWCGTNTVSFPATNTTSYELFIYVKSTPPPPTNGQPMTLQIQWQ